MICGRASFKHVDDGGPLSAPSSPKAAARATSSPLSLRKKASKNPYTTRGLDKYSTVVSELEARRAKIMEKVGPEGSSMVWFEQSNSTTGDWKPVVVKLDDDDSSKRPSAPSSPPRKPLEAAAPPREKRSSSWREWIEPRYYWVVVVVMILACLTLFGRMFAICCTSIWWYLMPTLRGEEAASARRPTSNKDFYRTRIGDVRTSANFLPSSPAKRSVGTRARHQ